MGMPAGRIGDIGVGTCSAHPGTISIVTMMSTGAPTVKVNGVSVTTSISIGLSSCGHASIVLSFSATVKANGNGIHRMGDSGILPGGAYILTSGSSNVKVGG
jgi:uncharacterized Zn-binding protein involved in type VI secretion